MEHVFRTRPDKAVQKKLNLVKELVEAIGKLEVENGRSHADSIKKEENEEAIDKI
jgi:hypothetical protein